MGSSPAVLLHSKSELFPISMKEITRGKQNRLSFLLFNVETGKYEVNSQVSQENIPKELFDVFTLIYCKIDFIFFLISLS